MRLRAPVVIPGLEVPNGPQGTRWPRALRGGSWSSPSGRLHVTIRLWFHPRSRDVVCGFRVVLEVK